jgi:hypothetical protein
MCFTLLPRGAFGVSQSKITSGGLASSNQRAGISLPDGNFSLVVQAGHDRAPLPQPSPVPADVQQRWGQRGGEESRRAGDALVEPADVVMDRAFTLEAPREAV